MAKNKILQPYADFQAFQRRWGVIHPAKENWRLTPYQYAGEINGLPQSRGWLTATDGILCYIESNGNQPPYFGHIQHFIFDDASIEVKAVVEATKQGRKTLKDEELNRLLDEYE